MRLGCVSYINALPLIYPLSAGIIKHPFTLTYAPPSHLNRALNNQTLDIALTSAVQYFDGNFKRIPRFGIAAHEKILSVNLYSPCNPRDMTGMRIGLTPESAAASSLLRVLCAHVWEVTPEFVSLETPHHDAFLLIGDQALKQQNIAGYKTYDLASEWSQATSLPFVFALFSAQKNCETHSLSPLLEEALTWSQSHFEVIEEEAILRSSLPKELIQRYYRACQYRLGERELAGLETFRRLRADLPSLPNILS